MSQGTWMVTLSSRPSQEFQIRYHFQPPAPSCSVKVRAPSSTWQV